MKKKIVNTMLIILGCLIAFSFYKVEATQLGTTGASRAAETSETSDETEAPETTGGFENAKFELKKDGTSKAIIEISNVTPTEASRYTLFINSNNSKPNVTMQSEEGIDLEYDTSSKILKTTNSTKVAKYVELNQDLYATILKYNTNDFTEEILTYGNKLERFAEPKYSDAFYATFISSTGTQIVTNFTHAKENTRKMQIKIGKITDTSILQKIKAQDSSGFAELLSFAKSNKGIYDETTNIDYIDISYSDIDGNSKISLSGLQNNAYYFLYVKVEGENGKYISSEGVTLSQAMATTNYWSLHFLGSDDFKWADFGNTGTPSTPSTPTDGTTVPGKLPQTGVNTIIWTTLAIILIGGTAIHYIQYRKNNF